MQSKIHPPKGESLKIYMSKFISYPHVCIISHTCIFIHARISFCVFKIQPTIQLTAAAQMQFCSILKRGKPRKFVFKEEKFSSRVESRDGKSIAMKAWAGRK